MIRKLGQYKPPPGTRINFGHPLSRGLVGYWPFNEGSGDKVFDLSLNKTTGTFTNSPLWLPGTAGSAIDFQSADDDYVDFGNPSHLELYSNLTVIIGFKHDGGTYQRLFAKGRSDGTGSAHPIEVRTGSSETTLELRGYDSTATLYSCSATISNNTFYQLAATVEPTAVKLYLNGLYQSEDSITGGLSTIRSAYHWLLATRDSAAGHGDWIVEYVYFYDRTLSTGEISRLYREPFCMLEREIELSTAVVTVKPWWYYHEMARRAAG